MGKGKRVRGEAQTRNARRAGPVVYEPTDDRKAKGDLEFGEWEIDKEFIRDAITGRPKVDDDGRPLTRKIMFSGYRRADRVKAMKDAGTITEPMYRAARFLAQASETAGLIEAPTVFNPMKVDGSSAGGKIPPIEAAAAAREVQHAIAALGGTGSLIGGVVQLVVVHRLLPAAIEERLTWRGMKVSREQLMGVLRAGLDTLARFYRLH